MPGQNRILDKTLVFGVIVLFISVAVQPAFGYEASIRNTSTVVEDCGCQPVNRFDNARVRILQKKLDVFTKSVIYKYKHIPENIKYNNFMGKFRDINEVLEIHEELSNFINSNESNFIRPLCILLEILLDFYMDLADYFFAKVENILLLPGDGGLLFYLFSFIGCTMIAFSIHIIGTFIFCWNPPPVP